MAIIPVFNPRIRANDLIDDAIAAHGALPVMLRSLRRLLIVGPRKPHIGELDPHLRRDLGLSPQPDHRLRGPHLML